MAIGLPSTNFDVDMHLESNLALQVKQNTEALIKIKEELGIEDEPSVPLGYSLSGNVYRNLTDQVLHNTQVISDIGLDIQVYVVPLQQKILELEGDIEDLNNQIDDLNLVIEALRNTIALKDEEIEILKRQSPNKELANDDLAIIYAGYLYLDLGHVLADTDLDAENAALVQIIGGVLS